jgi:hypothetical protein
VNAGPSSTFTREGREREEEGSERERERRRRRRRRERYSKTNTHQYQFSSHITCITALTQNMSQLTMNDNIGVPPDG